MTVLYYNSITGIFKNNKIAMHIILRNILLKNDILPFKGEKDVVLYKVYLFHF